MKSKLKVSYFKPYEPGVMPMGNNGSKQGNGLAFAFDLGSLFGACHNFGVILYLSNETVKIPFSEEGRFGSLYGLCIEGMDDTDILYDFYTDNSICHDPYAVSYDFPMPFGKTEDKKIKSRYYEASFDWGNDSNPNIPYENSVLYGLNVRAFTMHHTSKVNNPGTFEGVIEKLGYIKKLGATAIVLMPCYEYDECLLNNVNNIKNTDEMNKVSALFGQKADNIKINCWGFQDAYYFAPKALYSANNDPVNSFKSLVKNAHKMGIEVIMHFYFSPNMMQNDMLRALKFWAYQYHVDGFRVSGFNIPYRSILSERTLKDCKIWLNYIPGEDFDIIPNEPFIRTYATDNYNFRYDIRRFNKGDEGILGNFISLQKKNPQNVAVINYLCDYDGFSLKDLYCYERKHNELNGENNKDGNDANYSWNCGVEGESKKKSITECRIKQIKNALTFLFLSAGTPYIFSGDEFGNSRYGNNNAYCMDNEIGYVEWKDNSFSRQILEYTKNIILLRMNNPIFHMKNELKNLDVLKSGYPDLSYHGFEAWRPDLSYNSRTIGLFFYGPSCGDENAHSYYVGINMHWENHRIAVPKLKKNTKFHKILDTSLTEGISKDNEIPVLGRSIAIYEVY